MRHRSAHFSILLLLIVVLPVATVTGALPREVRRELSQMSKEAKTVSGLVRKKKINEAKAVIEQLDQQVTALNIANDERDRAWTGFQKQLERARNAIPVSFESDVAPILTANCTRCHGTDRAAANLRLDTFNGLRRGGRNGVLLQPRNPANSLVMGRLTATNEQQRMPRNAERLPDAELSTIGKWIAGGANFDGDDQDAPIGQSTKEPPAKVDIVMADGSETVSFKDDVAPVLVNFCLRCHRGNDPRGGFSIATITDVLRGGDTDNTIVPGDSGSSYLWQLVGLQDPIKMPQGQALLKRSQAQAIKRWIDEGAHFDGNDIKATLRSMVPTASEKEAGNLAAMSDEDFARRRMEQAVTIWKRTAPREDAGSVTTDNFYVYGNVGTDRLTQISKLAETQLTRLQDQYGGNETSWRGRLIIFANQDRFEYAEFNTVLLNRRTPPEVHGHVVITDQLATAYAVFHDRNNKNSATELSSDQLLNLLVAQAWLVRDGSALPNWLQQGFGMTESGGDAKFFSQLKPQALQAARGLRSPIELFNNASFSPTDTRIVGVMLTRFLLTQGNTKFKEFVNALRSESNTAEAIISVYGQPAETVAQAFLGSLSR